MREPSQAPVKRFWDDRNEAGRLGYIDGLRALAVLLVMLFHARVHAPGVALGFYREGSHGVDLFFVLSGFCLSMPTLEKLARAGSASFDLSLFAAKRVFRIVPPFAAAVLAFAAIGMMLRAHGIALPSGMSPDFTWADVASEVFFMDRGLHHINSSFWSLAIEFRWYFVFPLVLALWVARSRAYVALIVAVIVASEMTRASSTDLGVLPAFLLGIVAAHVRLHPAPWIRFAPFYGLAAAAVALLLERSYHFPIQTNAGWHAVAFFFVVWVGNEPLLRRIFGSRLLSGIGVASYSIYLVHEPIESAIMHSLAPRDGFWFAALVAGVVGLAAGSLAWALVERPGTDRLTVARFVRAFQPLCARVLAYAGIPNVMTLTSGTPKAAAPPLTTLQPASIAELVPEARAAG